MFDRYSEPCVSKGCIRGMQQGCCSISVSVSSKTNAGDSCLPQDFSSFPNYLDGEVSGLHLNFMDSRP